MVTVTDKAKSKIDHLMQDTGLDGSYFLRVSVQGGGCSGLSYNLDFDNEIKKGDQFFEDKGVRMTLDMKSFLYLAGTELDFRIPGKLAYLRSRKEPPWSWIRPHANGGRAK